MQHDDESFAQPARREFLRKSLTLIPVVTLASAGVAAPVLMSAPNSMANAAPPVPAEVPQALGITGRAYTPSFFTTEEWAFVNAAVALLIPADDLGPGAKEAGVPEFIDRQMQTSYGSGGLWYMQGPFKPDSIPEMGYQLQLVPQQIYRLGIAATDDWCKAQFGKVFAELTGMQQQNVLEALDSGKAKFDAVPAATFFSFLWSNTREGFFSDPIHGGNQGLVGWKLINFPGARADFMDWVERDERYPFPSVSISGVRG